MSVITSELQSATGLVRIGGSFLGGDEVDKLREALFDSIQRGWEHLIIDVSQVDYLNSAAIGVLVSIHTSYRRREWRLILCGVNKFVYSILTITKLNMIFETAGTKEDALRLFSSGRG